MIPDELLPGYSGWKDARTGEPLSLSQYLGHLLDQKGPTGSLVVAMLHLAEPEIRQQGEYVFVEEQFSRSKFEDLIAQGKRAEEVEYWMNLLGLSATFDVLTDPQLNYVARALQKLWAARLSETRIEGYECRLLFDDDEWYLTICRKDVFRDEGAVGDSGQATNLDSGSVANADARDARRCHPRERDHRSEVS